MGQTNIVEQDVQNWNNAANLIDTKANIDTPIFTGHLTTDRSPARGDNSFKLATTSFVQSLWNNIAPVEITNKASTNYNAGDYIVMQGTLYKVTATIAQGVTLINGTNITPTTITDELKALINS
jgi:hypothetical protein